MDTYAGSAPVVYSNGHDDDGGFGGNGIWAILLLALLGRGGFGGYGEGCNAREAVDNAELNARFNGIEDRISDLGSREDLRSNLKEICDTHMSVLQTECNLGTQIQEAKFDNAIIAKNAEIAALECCCTTNRNIDSVKFEAALANCDLKTAVHAEGEATRALIQQDKIEALRDKVSALEMANSQCAQNAALINALRPYPTPSYITYNPEQTFFPPTPAISAQQAYGFGNYGCCNG